MTHREFLLWLRPQLEKASTTGLSREDVSAIRDELEKLRKLTTLQPFSSKLYSLVREHTMLDVKTVAGLAAEVRIELAPRREATMVLSAADMEPGDKPRG